MPNPSSIQPMVDMFASILTRLDALESAGGAPPSANQARELSSLKQETRAAVAKMEQSAGTVAVAVPVVEVAESVQAYDEYVNSYVQPLVESCNGFDGKLKNVGQLILDAWDSIRTIIVLASMSKKPSGDVSQALKPHLEKTQTAIKTINSLRMHRDYDRHYKGIVEMVLCCSWVVMSASKSQKPSVFIKETLGASEFWLNRIRKDFKNDEKHTAFCNKVKAASVQLSNYVEKYHKTELSWNPQGNTLEKTVAAVGNNSPASAPPPPKPSVVVGGGSSFMSELAKKKTADGDSAATGLKKVSRDQQTWRKEYSASDAKPVVVKKKNPFVLPTKKPAGGGAGKVGTPVFEYQTRGFRWAIEHQTEQSAKENHNGMITVTIKDPKEQVYLYKCTGITVKIEGKFKAVVMETCKKCNVVFETVISSVEVVNSDKVQLQTSGICPVFTIDKTHGCLIWLSEKSKSVSSFVTSQSSEMNISFPDGDEQKEVPIPQQFVHQLLNGKVTSEVSSLYSH